MASSSYIVHSRISASKPSQNLAAQDPMAQKTGNQRTMPKSASTSASAEFMAMKLGIKKVKSSIPPRSQPSKKRKFMKLSEAEARDENLDEEDKFAAAMAQDALEGIGSPKKNRASRKKGEELEEKRLRRHRAKAPLSYLERLDRVKTQRMFLIDRNRSLSSDETHEEEVFQIAGTTGNIYSVTVSKVPNCTCPDALKGNHCKHILYVMINVLKAREDLAYQLALLSTELTEIFANAPAIPQADATATDTERHRKPIEGDCPVCVMEFDINDKFEEIVWCKGACGNNIHRHCFEQWARSKPEQVKCVYCRTPWKGDEDSIKRITKNGGAVNQEGYVNVGSQLGLSGERDMSTYHQYWVRRQFGDRYDGYDEYEGDY